ncbi:chain length determinant family protein [Nocardiopsis sp. FIRDI 009]|uniref:chain length determinant family protein n=1 Tax=Nocardiopsis sp. FIRDI 009 TaxID=714197 RepID=UPI000E25DECA|nr:chain length determinant family protein [Nocardiopsis sp. FIRDI 009]
MDTDAPGPPGPELKEYTALLRRRWRLVGAGVLGGLVLATAGVVALPSTYESTAAVQVRPTGMAEFTGERSGRLAGEVNLDTEAQVVLSDRVSAAAAAALAEPDSAPADPAELRESVSLSVPPNSNVLEITYAAGSPEAAREGADAYARAYLEQREAEVGDLIAAHLAALRGEQEARYEELAELADDSSARAETLRAEIADLGRGVGPLTALRETVEPGRIITPANLPESAASPVVPVWLAGGTAAGLLAGLLLAFARDRLDPVLRDTEETARIGGAPVLLDLTGADREASGPFGDDDRAGQRVNECAHALRARVPSPGVLLVVATAPGRSGPAAAVNLAASLARTGSDTLLVYADPAADPLDLPPGPGLAEALLDGEDPAELEVRPDTAPRLRVLRYGRPEAVAPVQGTAMPELLGLLREGTEYVVVAVPPATERADAHALAASADLLLPVVELGRTRRADLVSLVAAAARFGLPVPGVAALPRPARGSDDASRDARGTGNGARADAGESATAHKAATAEDGAADGTETGAEDTADQTGTGAEDSAADTVGARN